MQCDMNLLRHVEDCVVQLQETAKDVEGLEEEAICLTDVLMQSVYQDPVFCQTDNQSPSFLPWNKLLPEQK